MLIHGTFVTLLNMEKLLRVGSERSEQRDAEDRLARHSGRGRVIKCEPKR